MKSADVPTASAAERNSAGPHVRDTALNKSTRFGPLKLNGGGVRLLMSASRFRPDLEHFVPEEETGAAAGSNGNDIRKKANEIKDLLNFGSLCSSGIKSEGLAT